MDLKIGDMVEVTNGQIVKIIFEGITLDGHIIYGTGRNPIVIMPLENIVRKIKN